MMNSIGVLALVLIMFMIATSHGQYFSAHEGSVLSRNGKRSYLFDLLRSPDLDSTNSKKTHLLSGSDAGVYQADKLSVRNKFRKFGRRSYLGYMSDRPESEFVYAHPTHSNEDLFDAHHVLASLNYYDTDENYEKK